MQKQVLGPPQPQPALRALRLGRRLRHQRRQPRRRRPRRRRRRRSARTARPGGPAFLEASGKPRRDERVTRLPFCISLYIRRKVFRCDSKKVQVAWALSSVRRFSPCRNSVLSAYGASGPLVEMEPTKAKTDILAPKQLQAFGYEVEEALQLQPRTKIRLSLCEALMLSRCWNTSKCVLFE